jgi:hypothetical protein
MILDLCNVQAAVSGGQPFALLAATKYLVTIFEFARLFQTERIAGAAKTIGNANGSGITHHERALAEGRQHGPAGA